MLIALAVGFFCPIASASQSDTINNVWRVVQAKGDVQTRTTSGQNTWKTVNSGASLTAPAYLRTGPDSRIVLMHRNDKITVASSSVIMIEAEKKSSNGLLTRIIQTIGYALFDIEHNTGRTNIIETPYLVSVIKGTTFTVQVSQDRTIVNLIKGRILTKAAKFNASTYINSGQSAELGKGDKAISVLDTHVTINPAAVLHKNNPIMPNSTSQNARKNPAFDSKGHANIKATAATSGIAGATESMGPLLPAQATGSHGPLAPLLPTQSQGQPPTKP